MPHLRRRARLATPLLLLAAATPGAAQAPAGAPDSARRVPLEGVVYDSVAAGPLVGALLQLSDLADPARALSATTDSAGRYRFDAVRPGRYLAGFIHPVLDVLGIATPTVVVDVADRADGRLDLAIPGPARMRAALCGPAAAADSGGTLLGVTQDAETGVPLDDARVVLSWMELELRRRGVQLVPRHVTVPVGPGGRFVACGIPTDADLTATAESPGRRSGTVEITAMPHGIARRDFLLGAAPAAATAATAAGAAPAPRPPARGSASVAGTVRRANGRPIDHARVLVHDTPVSGETGANGAYALGGLPAGTHTLEVRALGFAPKRVAVDLASRAPATADVVLEERVATLERVLVKGEARRSTLRDRRLEEFTERRLRGFGRFVTAADIERRNASVMTDALRLVPGLQIVPSRTGGLRNVIRGRQGCMPDVYLDGMLIFEGANDIDMFAIPSDILGVEVYLGLGSIPVQYSRYGNTCGSVVMWTK